MIEIKNIFIKVTAALQILLWKTTEIGDIVSVIQLKAVQAHVKA